MTNIPGAFNPIQAESLQFNNPESQASQSALGAAINGMLSVLTPVGTVIGTMLTPTEFQTQQGNPSPPNFVLADGSAYPTSTYAGVTGNTNVPDLRGVFLRGKNNGRSGSTGNPDGDLALGTFQADEFGSHDHNYADPGHTHGFNQSIGLRFNNYFPQPGTGLSAYDALSSGLSVNSATTGITVNTQGGAETRPRNVTINWMIRIN